MRGALVIVGTLLGTIAGCSCSDHTRMEGDAAAADASHHDASDRDAFVRPDVGNDAWLGPDTDVDSAIDAFVPPVDAAILGPECDPGCGAALDVCVSQQVVCAIRASDHVVVCWGLNVAGQLGDGTSLTTPRAHVVCPRGDCSTAVEVIDDASGAPLHATHVACADGAVCAVRADGAVVCWGSNSDGQLGRSLGTSMLARAGVVPGLPASDLATDVVGGWARFCATTASGASWCWGRDPTGEWGEHRGGAASPFASTLWPSGSTPLLGADHDCVLRGGALSCLGDGAYGELGPNAHFAAQRTPVAVPLPGPATSVTTVWFATCALVDGVPYCWGASDYGQIGRLPPSSASCGCDESPAPVPGVSGLVDLWPGARSPEVCGHTASGDVVCWGTLTDYCALPGGFCDSAAPLPALHGARVIDSSQYTSCVIFDADGRLECFGANANRQLGSQGPARSIPVRTCLCESP